ncbi:MAG: GTP cyclohydrolase II [candidate division Zixibacteria bacterium]|nr:GTP cyclohydrolase II [candidate division Zixibacteria bacterium]
MINKIEFDRANIDRANIDRVSDAIEDISSGKMVVVVDSESRENEGDLVMAAESISPADLNFMVTHARGLVCAPMAEEYLDRLELGQMSSRNTARLETKFTVSVDLVNGTTTGISAADRSRALNALADPRSSAKDFARPGHVFPIRAAKGGVSERPGHTEAAVELCRLAGKSPVGVVCEIMSADGTMARGAELIELSKKWNLKIIRISDLIAYISSLENLTQARISNGSAKSNSSSVAPVQSDSARPCGTSKISEVDFPTEFGDFRLALFESREDRKEHLAIIKGDIKGQNTLTRIHSECLTGDSLGSKRCDCRAQLAASLSEINQAGRGVVLYMRQEGRGIGLANKIKAYALQDAGADTVDANHQLGFETDLRDYAACASMLKSLGVESVNLLTNNPLKIKGLEANGILVTKRETAETPATDFNRAYLLTKRDRMGHFFDALQDAQQNHKEDAFETGSGSGGDTRKVARK